MRDCYIRCVSLGHSTYYQVHNHPGWLFLYPLYATPSVVYNMSRAFSCGASSPPRRILAQAQLQTLGGDGAMHTLSSSSGTSYSRETVSHVDTATATETISRMLAMSVVLHVLHAIGRSCEYCRLCIVREPAISDAPLC